MMLSRPLICAVSLVTAVSSLSLCPRVEAADPPSTPAGSSVPLTPATPAPPATPATPATKGPTADEIAERVQSLYSTTRTFSATFSQVYRSKKLGVTRRGTGKVVFSKPGKMSWTYDDPAGNRVVSDGTTLRAYDHESARLYEQPADRTAYPSALAFLIGQGSLGKSFTLRLVPQDKLKFPGGHILEGIPKEATPAHQRVYFFVDAETAQVRRVVFVDAQANQNRFDFSSPVVNATPEEGLFVLRAPVGTITVRPQND